MDTMEQMRRWRLILGAESETQFETMNGYGEAGLSKEQLLMDQALAAITAAPTEDSDPRETLAKEVGEDRPIRRLPDGWEM